MQLLTYLHQTHFDIVIYIAAGLFTACVLSFVMLYVLWLFFLAVMALKRARDEGRLSRSAYYLAQPIVIFGVAYDIFCNLTVMWFIMFEVPREWKVTDRVSRHLDSKGWRGIVARYMCHDLLDPFEIDCHCKKP